MSSFVYLLAEGVTDVTLITRVLRRYLSMTRIKTRADLPDGAKTWLDGFRWPVGGDIARLAVPAPVFMRRSGVLVAIRNAQSLDQIHRLRRPRAWRPRQCHGRGRGLLPSEAGDHLMSIEAISPQEEAIELRALFSPRSERLRSTPSSVTPSIPSHCTTRASELGLKRRR